MQTKMLIYYDMWRMWCLILLLEMAFLPYQVTGKSWDAHDDDPLYYECGANVESWRLKISVVKIPVKQDIRINWWVLLVEASISPVVAGAGDQQDLATCACWVEEVGSRGRELDLELSVWSINLEWIVFTIFWLVIYLAKCYTFQYLWYIS